MDTYTKEEYSPLPWDVVSEDSPRVPYLIRSAEGVTVAQIYREDYARFIARAVNNHTALIDALRLVITRYDIARDIHWRQQGLSRPQDDDTDTIRAARAALAAAQE